MVVVHIVYPYLLHHANIRLHRWLCSPCPSCFGRGANLKEMCWRLSSAVSSRLHTELMSWSLKWHQQITRAPFRVSPPVRGIFARGARSQSTYICAVLRCVEEGHFESEPRERQNKYPIGNSSSENQKQNHGPAGPSDRPRAPPSTRQVSLTSGVVSKGRSWAWTFEGGLSGVTLKHCLLTVRVLSTLRLACDLLGAPKRTDVHQ